MNTRTIKLATAYGDELSCEQVPPSEFAGALRRAYDRAIRRTSAVIVLDGVTHTRNSFLEFVRHFDDTEARTARRADA